MEMHANKAEGTRFTRARPTATGLTFLNGICEAHRFCLKNIQNSRKISERSKITNVTRMSEG
jgi:hypothetical protein